MYRDYVWVVETNDNDGKGWHCFDTVTTFVTRKDARQRVRELREYDGYYGVTARYRVKKYKRVD